MSVTEKWTNPGVLCWARKRLNLAVEQVVGESRKLAKRHFAAISGQDLTAWEAGTAEPELVHLETLAEIYACPVGYFFLDS
jgi:transcriptional regulator with XRE-family HTH domain